MNDAEAVRHESVIQSQVDSETAEQFIAEKHIGERIKRLRLKKSMGLVELGRHTGLSASFLSQLEPFTRTDATIATLQNGLPFWYVRRPPLESVDPGGRIGAFFDDQQIVGGVGERLSLTAGFVSTRQHFVLLAAEHAIGGSVRQKPE